MTTQSIRFWRRGAVHEVRDVPITRTVLQYLREDLHACGTKEGCAEGDCGACMVVVGDLDGEGHLVLKAVNACIEFLPTLDGRALFTVEELRAPDGALHPVQQALVDCHGSQCGFCTPGFAMSLWTLYEHRRDAPGPPARDEIHRALSGNLCRCTGYRPIVEAAERMADSTSCPRVLLDRTAIEDALRLLKRTGTFEYHGPDVRGAAYGTNTFFAPRTLADFAALLAARPEARVLAGGTDIGLWVTKQLRDLGDVIYTGNVTELCALARDDEALTIGAAVPLEPAWAALVNAYPELSELWTRFGSLPVRNAGTLGGNVANGSPIGDSMPALLALDAQLVLRHADRTRTLPLAAFYTGYQKNALAPGEFIEAIRVPRRRPALRVYAGKVAKRYDQDISAVCAAFALDVGADGVIASARVAFGGMSATPLRAMHTEAALTGARWDEATAQRAMDALATDYAPLTDLRASAAYRSQVARNLLWRCWLQTRDDAPLASRDTEAFVFEDEHAPATKHAADTARAAPGAPLPHESAELHVSGEARYTDDIPELRGTLHVALGLSRFAHARIVSLDLDRVRKAPGVVAVLSAADIPGENNCGPVLHDDPVLAQSEVQYLGQPVFAVIATSHELARRAAALAACDDVVRYEPLEPVLSIAQAVAMQHYVLPPLRLTHGRPAERIAAAPHRLAGTFEVGGQEQFYLEGQVAYALPQEQDGMLVYSSTQHPSEMQQVVAHLLGWPAHRVACECRRMGGGFGGKESQSALFACVAALAAHKTGHPVKLRADRDDDFLITGKRHDAVCEYEAGFDDTGRVLGARVQIALRAGYSADLSGAVATRAVCHVDNAYYLGDVEIVALCCKTNTQSNTAFRGFGAPQGALVTEVMLDAIAKHLKRDPLDVRRANYYGIGERDVTPYGQRVEGNVLAPLTDALLASSRYRERRAALIASNRVSPVLKRGIAITPVKFGISFNVPHMNQAGALVHVYRDGSVLVNHGGTEMGQGLHTKVAQVVAGTFGLPLARVRVNATDTAKVANTSATAASTGSDLNGKAAEDAALTIRARLATVAAAESGGAPEAVSFDGGMVHANGVSKTFAQIVELAYLRRVQLWSDGFYATPKVHWDAGTLTGHPFYYFAYGAAVSEVVVDTLTGEWRLVRVDALHDAGASINPAIDMGQIEGGFIQGMGWLTTEELWWNRDGRLMTHSPSTYKIPSVSDTPAAFTMQLYRNENVEPTILRSKAVGEPPLLLAFSVFLAIRDAIGAAVPEASEVAPLRAPATPEAILAALDALRERAAATHAAPAAAVSHAGQPVVPAAPRQREAG